MSARPPPARPHIGVHSSYFSRTTSSSGDWGEDDAWDSGSDSESPRRSTASNAWNQSPPSSTSRSQSTMTPPKLVPRPPLTNSSTLSFSYTHVTPPSPSSYPPRNGWTIVRKKGDGRRSRDDNSSAKDEEINGDIDVESDMVVGEGDLEPEVIEEDPTISLVKSRRDRGSIKDDVDEIVNDPLFVLSRRTGRHKDPRSRSRSRSPDGDDSAERVQRERSIRTNRRHKFISCLGQDDINIASLRKLGWQGIPNDLRPAVWPLLLGYIPLPSHLRSSTLKRKRDEYASLVELAFARDRAGLDQQIWHQIEIDVPRTRPGVRLWMQGSTQRSLERILYVWAIRHPASGYVQGINDLVTPFFQVFLSAYIDSDPEDFDPTNLPPHVLNAIEADSFWCLSRLLDGIQDNYISAQPGIQRSVKRMAELVARIDPPLSAHLASQGVEFMQFAFRWMNCLLMREISVQNTIRMWDTYLSEGADAFSQFHLYVCSAFLVKWSEKLRQMDFQGIIMFLQSLPTQGWTDHDVEMLLSEAFVLSSTWQNAQSHFTGK
ncbi:hypothetical protein JAAARDRAFT_35331 [Jaapia argillacea MUCL 33604]|uniref:Rab-GAP TBC domain-containing protein n=1 Tax=Jaapia argillacea MUCL 33604 TaxID=933084 RepID=A0A067Q4W5_9AGAM|nr:hypothetical protein JAAARDRAFT_35331 [Jaapia argillacea MUCL 33604]